MSAGMSAGVRDVLFFLPAAAFLAALRVRARYASTPAPGAALTEKILGAMPALWA